MTKAPLVPRRVVCIEHPGGPRELYPGREPAVPSECRTCQEARLEAARRAEWARLRRWRRRPAMTAAELDAAPDPFEMLLKEG